MAVKRQIIRRWNSMWRGHRMDGYPKNRKQRKLRSIQIRRKLGEFCMIHWTGSLKTWGATRRREHFSDEEFPPPVWV